MFKKSRGWAVSIAMVGCTAAFASVPTVAYANSNTIITNPRSGPVTVNGQLWHTVPYITAQNTTFFGIWYLQQLLRNYGIQATWNGLTLNIDSLPNISGASTLTVNGATANSSSTLAYQGHTLIDVTAVIQALHGTAQYDDLSSTLTLIAPPNSFKDSSIHVQTKPNGTDVHLATTLTSSVQMGTVQEAGRTWHTVPIIRYQGTTFFGVWYLQSFLRSHGIQNSWNGKQLSIDNLPRMIQGTLEGPDGTTTNSQLVQWNGHWYVPSSSLQSLGAQVSGNSTAPGVSWTPHSATAATVTGTLQSGAGSPMTGQVAVMDGHGNIQVVSADASGTFTAQMDTGSGTIIGSNAGGLGWIGQAIPANGASAVQVVNNAQSMTDISGQIHFAGGSYGVTELSVRNLITHEHLYANVNPDGTFHLTVPTGAYEVFGLVTNSDVVFSAQTFVAGGDSINLVVQAPVLPTGMTLNTQYATITAKDSSVTPAQMASVGMLFARVYPEVIQKMGMKPNSIMQIDLYGTTTSYQKHFTDEGYSTSDAQQIAENSVAAEEGTNVISVLMPSYGQVDGRNILAHEFTHAVIAAVSTNIDSWANEGIAWTDGISAALQGSPDAVLQQSLNWNEWMDIVQHEKDGDLLPLGQPNPLAGTYNLEDQDYFAVNQLEQQFGFDEIMRYVQKIDLDSQAFSDTFGETFDQFSSGVTAVLQQDAMKSTGAFNVSLRTMPGDASKVMVINPSGQAYVVSGVQSGTVYTLCCETDGTVSVTGGASVTLIGTSYTGPSGGWFVGSTLDGSTFHQGFALNHQFGVAYLTDTILYDGSGNLVHEYAGTAVPDGIQLISVSDGAN